MDSFEEMALRVGRECFPENERFPYKEAVINFARRLRAEWMAQEPVAWVEHYRLNLTIAARVVPMFDLATLPNCTRLYAAPVSKPAAKDVPEGCTPADAQMLREANHALAAESHRRAMLLREWLKTELDAQDEEFQPWIDDFTARVTEEIREDEESAQDCVSVPREPTDEMLRAGWNAYLDDMKGGLERFAITYRAMLAAAPNAADQGAVPTAPRNLPEPSDDDSVSAAPADEVMHKTRELAESQLDNYTAIEKEGMR